jgi:hypothetical protein
MAELKRDGTFITLSQYLEDLTRYNSEGENYRISPSSYVCYNCDFNGWTDSSIIEKINDFENEILSLKQSSTIEYTHELFKNEFNDYFTFLDNIVYEDDIDIKSHNLHNGIGYTELYCHIPETAGDGLSMSFNTIVVYYDVINSQTENTSIVYEKIPVGIYFTGTIQNGVMSNSVIKHNFDANSNTTGSSYGLKICSRYILGGEPNIEFSSDIEYDNLSHVLSKMSESQESIQNAVRTMVQNNEQYKSLLSIFKNNRTNVPYIKDVKVLDENTGRVRVEKHWFVNGRDLGVTVVETE